MAPCSIGTVTRGRPRPPSRPRRLTSVWGSGPGDAWAAGQFGAYHFDQSSSQLIEAVSDDALEGRLNSGLGGSGAGDIWVVGTGGMIWHFDGQSWSKSNGQKHSWAAVWSSAGDDAWTVGFAGTALHWDGNSWTPVPTGSTANLLSIWGSRRNDIWVTTANRDPFGEGGMQAPTSPGTMLHWDGSAWTPFVATAALADLLSVS